ncbi:hypothetical protein HMSSN036_44800 [Paenibacillus macerans]|nr:hypothetical protein HMSSN036_44800 [Paenibacillus macerans]
MKHPEEYRGRQVVVIGLARSGVQVAKTLHRFGAVVTVNDKKERELCPEASELEALGISVVCGGHPDGLVHPGVELVVKNPGIPYSAPPVAKALELGIDVVTEVEIAYRLSPAPIIGITGSNGKNDDDDMGRQNAGSRRASPDRSRQHRHAAVRSGGNGERRQLACSRT